MNELDAIISLVNLWQQYERDCHKTYADSRDERTREHDRWIDAKTALYQVNEAAIGLIAAASERSAPVWPAQEDIVPIHSIP